MDIGSVLIWLTTISAIGVLVCTFLLLLTKNAQFRKFLAPLTLITILFITLAYLILTYYFLTSNYDIHYVWYNSSKNTEWYLKLTGVWAGQEGSLLLWVWIILISLGIEEVIQLRRIKKSLKKNMDYEDDSDQYEDQDYDPKQKSFTTYDWVRLIVILVSLVFLILIVLNDPFESTHPHVFNEGEANEFIIYPKDYPAGHGMNPMLRNMWMVIHPPLLFLGYAFITIPFAASISYSLTGDKKWTKISLQWSRIAWLFLTLGIGIGAVWAYVALGWGGYWAWDPVEVGSLIPWITLSGFMHAQLMNKRKKQFRYITPILGTVTFVLIIFATFITRSGWWKSVHAWSETEVGWILLGTMIITLIMSGLIILRDFYLNYIKKEKFESYEEEDIQEEKTDLNTLNMLITIVLFIVTSVIVFYVLMITTGEVKPEEYEVRLTPVILLLMGILISCLCWRYFGKENSIYIIAWTSLAAVASAVLVHSYSPFPGKTEDFYGSMITTHDIVGFMIPFIIVVSFAAIYKIIKSVKMKSKRTSMKIISAHIIHLAVGFIIIGYAASQTMIVEKNAYLGEGNTFKVDEYEIVIEKIEIEVDSGDLKSREYWDTWIVTFEIYKDGDFVQKGQISVIFGYYFDDGIKKYNRIMTSEVFVGQMVDEDLYLSMTNIRNNDVLVTARIIPLMSFLWFGMILFIVGIIIRMITDTKTSTISDKKKEDRIETKRKRDIKISRKESPSKYKRENRSGKSKKDYEKILEDELRRIRG